MFEAARWKALLAKNKMTGHPDEVEQLFEKYAEDGRIKRKGYSAFVQDTEGEHGTVDQHRWEQDCEGLECSPREGVNLSTFRKLCHSKGYVLAEQEPEPEPELVPEPVEKSVANKSVTSPETARRPQLPPPPPPPPPRWPVELSELVVIPQIATCLSEIGLGCLDECAFLE